MTDSIQSILAKWKQTLVQARAIYEGPVQIPLQPVDVLAVLDANCPAEFDDLHSELSERTPTHVLVTMPQLQSLIEAN